jgi:hypothetical protein
MSDHVIRIFSKPHASRPGQFDAWLDGECLCTSRQPLLDAARILSRRGVADDVILALRHFGSDYDAIRIRLGTAKLLTVSERQRVGLRLERWQPFRKAQESTNE